MRFEHFKELVFVKHAETHDGGDAVVPETIFQIASSSPNFGSGFDNGYTCHSMGRKNSQWVKELYQHHRSKGLSPQAAWLAAKNDFKSQSTSGDLEQAWKNASGRALEDIVLDEFRRQIEERAVGDKVSVS